MQKIDFLKFYVINTSDNLPFQPYFCNPHVISFQKMYVLSQTPGLFYLVRPSRKPKIRIFAQKNVSFDRFHEFHTILFLFGVTLLGMSPGSYFLR